MKKDQDFLNLLREIDDKPNASQRKLAEVFGLVWASQLLFESTQRQRVN